MKKGVLNSQQRAWITRRLKAKVNVENNEVTPQKIESFLKARPQTTEFIRTILSNLNLTNSELAVKLGKNEKIAKMFRTYAITSVLGKQKYSTGKKVKVKQKIATVDYKSDGKSMVRKAILKLLLESKSNVGIVPTLPFDFDFEKELIEIPALKGLYFNGYEYAYNKDKGTQCKNHFRTQIQMLENDKELAKRIIMRYQNINDVLTFGGENQYAHIFADYCGNFSTNKDAIEYILKNNLIKKGGLLWITLNTRSTNGDKNLKEVLPNFVEKIGGANYKIEKINGEKVYNYKGSKSGKGAPTLAIAVRRIK